jgi:hypothetical protein
MASCVGRHAKAAKHVTNWGTTSYRYKLASGDSAGLALILRAPRVGWEGAAKDEFTNPRLARVGA